MKKHLMCVVIAVLLSALVFVIGYQKGMSKQYGNTVRILDKHRVDIPEIGTVPTINVSPETMERLTRTTPISQTAYYKPEYVFTYDGEEVMIPLIGDKDNWIVIDILIEIESGGDPCAISPAGARGLCQIMKPTWKECTELLEVDWSWNDNWYVPAKSRALGIYYVNNRIPKMLEYYKIPDSIRTRLACYNWGIGNVRNHYTIYSEHGSVVANEKYPYPEETKNYINKYMKLLKSG